MQSPFKSIMDFTAGNKHLSDDELVGMVIYQDDSLIQHDLSLTQIEIVEVAFSVPQEHVFGKRTINSFEGWFLEHCLNRQIRPMEALLEFKGSKSIVIQQITIKALAQRYAIHESDITAATIARFTMWTMWATWATALIALTALIVSCSSGVQTNTNKSQTESSSQ